ncbi:hypothetical protein [Palleniella intestinalis]|nr:hypothetical protein [Palleniella intestinalis]
MLDKEWYDAVMVTKIDRWRGIGGIKECGSTTQHYEHSHYPHD